MNPDLRAIIPEWEMHYLVYTLDKVFYPRGDPEDIRKRLFGEHFGPSPWFSKNNKRNLGESIIDSM